MLGQVAALHKQALEYISGNMNIDSLQKIRRVMSQRRSENIFINTTPDQALSMFDKKVRTKCNHSNMRISFSVGIDATAQLKCYLFMSNMMQLKEEFTLISSFLSRRRTKKN